jgi:hypothetical protein
MQLASPPRWLEAPTMPAGTSDERRHLIRLFRALLLLNTALAILSMPIMLMERGALPEQLQEYVADIAADRFFLVGTGIAFILWAVLMVGLWYFKRWARLLFSLVVATAILVPWFQGAPDVQSAAMALASDLTAMSVGAALIFMWGVLRKEFGGPPYPLGAEKADR